MLTRRLTWAFVTAVLLTAFTNAPADARQHRKSKHHTHHYSKVHTPVAHCDDRYPMNCASQTRQERRTRVASTEGRTVIGGRPSGCPHAYCGCGARLYLGISDTRLNLAWNWTKYYHGSTPVAVWRHHVAIIIKMTGPNTALMRDYNGGRGLSYIHERSTAGARIVGSTLLAMR